MSSDSPAVIIYDNSGNPVGIILDGSVYRLQVEAKISSWFGSSVPTVGQKTSDNSIPVVIASDQSVIPTIVQSNTVVRTSVDAIASDTLLLASNSARRNAIITNDTTTAILKIGLGSTAVSDTDFTISVLPGGFFETPTGYYGEIRGIWNGDDGGNGAGARITEVTYA